MPNDHEVVREFLRALLQYRFWPPTLSDPYSIAIPDEDLVGDVVTLDVAKLKERYPEIWDSASGLSVGEMLARYSHLRPNALVADIDAKVQAGDPRLVKAWSK